jgi:predicted outer membrane protein
MTNTLKETDMSATSLVKIRKQAERLDNLQDDLKNLTWELENDIQDLKDIWELLGDTKYYSDMIDMDEQTISLWEELLGDAVDLETRVIPSGMDELARMVSKIHTESVAMEQLTGQA